MPLSDELIDQLLAGCSSPDDILGESGLLKQLTKLLVEKALDAELTEHLGHERHEAVVNSSGNTRNGKSKKTLKGKFGELPIEVPRDRHGSFEPQLIPKHQTDPKLSNAPGANTHAGGCGRGASGGGPLCRSIRPVEMFI